MRLRRYQEGLSAPHEPLANECTLNGQMPSADVVPLVDDNAVETSDQLAVLIKDSASGGTWSCSNIELYLLVPYDSSGRTQVQADLVDAAFVNAERNAQRSRADPYLFSDHAGRGAECGIGKTIDTGRLALGITDLQEGNIEGLVEIHYLRVNGEELFLIILDTYVVAGKREVHLGHRPSSWLYRYGGRISADNEVFLIIDLNGVIPGTRLVLLDQIVDDVGVRENIRTGYVGEVGIILRVNDDSGALNYNLFWLFRPIAIARLPLSLVALGIYFLVPRNVSGPLIEVDLDLDGYAADPFLEHKEWRRESDGQQVQAKGQGF
jgi:hypothetical protein